MQKAVNLRRAVVKYLLRTARQTGIGVRHTTEARVRAFRAQNFKLGAFQCPNLLLPNVDV